MGSKNDAPPAPDYTALANASQESAQYSYQLGQDQLQWARDQYNQDHATTQQVVDSFLNTQQQATQDAEADRARYEGVYQPLEDQLVNDANTYGSDGRRDEAMGQAQATVAQQFNGQRQGALQNLESFGIDPSSTRYAALDIGTRTAQAAAQAAAGTQASQNVDTAARALRSEAINVGRGYPGQIAGEYGTAGSAGNSAVQNTLAQTASGANTMGTAAQWQGLGNSAVGTWGNIINTGYQNALSSYQANQSASTGWGSALGLAGGLLTAFQTGGAVAAPGSGTPQNGGAVPAGASPSGGQAVDDVPSNLTVGEFVMPNEAVSWYGQKHMYAMVEKAKKERAELPARSGALPTTKMGVPQPPAFVSRPGGALPMGR